jgi:hypothetical protein
MRNLRAFIVCAPLVLAGCTCLVGPEEEKPSDDVADETGSEPAATAGETGTPAPAPAPKPGAAPTCEDELERVAKAQADLAACQEAK